MEIWHVTLAGGGRFPLIERPEVRRTFLRSVFTMLRSVPLLALGLADNHLHLLVAAPRVVIGEHLRRLRIAQARLNLLTERFDTPRFERVRDAVHLARAFHYVLRQPLRHAPALDGLGEGSSAWDLLGLRTVGAWTSAHVRTWLPRVGRSDLLHDLGLGHLRPAPVSVEEVRECVLAAAALPDLGGRNSLVREALCAAVHALPGVPPARVADALGISRRSVFRRRAEQPREDILRAISLQAALRRRAQESGRLGAPWAPRGKGLGASGP